MQVISEDIRGDETSSVTIHLNFSDGTSTKIQALQKESPMWNDINSHDNNPRSRFMDDESSDETDDNSSTSRRDPNCQFPRCHGEIVKTVNENIESTHGDDTVISISVESYPSTLPCPFSVRYPEQHLACLRYNFQRPLDVAEHLWTSHRRVLGHLCPTCGDGFEQRTACDSHIRQRACEQGGDLMGRDEGEELSSSQVYQLLELAREIEEEDNRVFAGYGRDRGQGKGTIRKSEEQGDSRDKTRSEWGTIWGIVFPHEIAPPQWPGSDADP
ncbi:hypothetical protein QBC34DRAFT_472352 [Podospora aff. communis PSN243]|uniref:C2H2-type domain-containing protein n=1 Tax=Podospora aff. communis PSN243 TaxID=3040156 RepID=A0AAV9GC03_9PEZI|nr:hypothetical protein QBC34DRAFT_472352 [Podospora aff. communis PSN243]